MKTTTINIGGEDIFCYDDKTKVSTFLCERHNVRFAHSKASVAFWHFVLGDSLRHPAPALSPLKIAELCISLFQKVSSLLSDKEDALVRVYSPLLNDDACSEVAKERRQRKILRNLSFRIHRGSNVLEFLKFKKHEDDDSNIVSLMSHLPLDTREEAEVDTYLGEIFPQPSDQRLMDVLRFHLMKELNRMRKERNRLGSRVSRSVVVI